MLKVACAGLLSGLVLSVGRPLPFLIVQCSIGVICSLTLHMVAYKSEFRKLMCNFSLFTFPSIMAILYEPHFGVISALPLLLLLNLAMYGVYLELRGFFLRIMHACMGKGSLR